MPNRLDTMKAQFAKHGGVAPSNRFNVIFTPPTVSLLNLNPTNLLGNIINNSFSWKSLISDPRDISILCKNASFPSRSLNSAEYQAQRESKKYITGKTDGDINMVFYVTNDMYMKTMFDSWMNHIFDTRDYRANYKRGDGGYCTDVRIQQVNKQGQPVYGVKLINAYPTQVGEMALDNTATDSIHELTVGWSYDYYEPENALTSSIGAIGDTLGGLFT